jgi:hypothetical protein
LLQRPDLDCSSVNKRLSWSQQGSLRMPETDPGGGGSGGGGGGGGGGNGSGGWNSSGAGHAFAGGVVIVGGPDNGEDQHSGSRAGSAASAAAAAGGNHSLSLSISTEFDPGWDNAGREPRLGGFIKIGGGGKSAPPSPLTTAARLFSSSPVQVSPGGGGGGRQCATPPVPPRNHQQHHVSSTYISQDRHTLIVTTPDSDRIPVKDCVNGGGGGTLVRTLRRPKADTAAATASVIAVKPEIKINLAEPREPAAVVPPISAATVSVVPPVSISISGQDGGGSGVKMGGNGGGVRGLGGGVKHGGGGSPNVVSQGHGAEKLRLREVLLTESS